METKLPPWEKLAKEIIWKQIGTIKNKNILDFGSGTGITSDYYAKNNNVIAIEPSHEMLTKQHNTNGYKQIIGSTDELKKINNKSFDLIICHNVLEYTNDRKEIINEFYRLLKPNGRLSIVKHNRNGRVMQMVCLLNNFKEANNLLDGKTSTAQKFGTINYYKDEDVLKWCNKLKLKKTYGLRTFWDLQQNQEIQNDSEWQKNMLDIEIRVSENSDYQNIAFFHHLIFTK
ncbi:MAG: methyltransferase domain-containing protein [Clostridia bacterium]|nr:methyltransferase domain-containing protein [Clostridia bacterium]